MLCPREFHSFPCVVALFGFRFKAPAYVRTLSNKGPSGTLSPFGQHFCEIRGRDLNGGNYNSYTRKTRVILVHISLFVVWKGGLGTDIILGKGDEKAYS